MLAKKLVMKALRKGGEAFLNRFDVRYYPGGAKTLWRHHLPIYAAEKRKDVLVLFDGDERPSSPLPDPRGVPENEDLSLKAALKQVAMTEINFYVDGGETGGNVDQESKVRRAFIQWARGSVDYLPGDGSPEEY